MYRPVDMITVDDSGGDVVTFYEWLKSSYKWSLMYNEMYKILTNEVGMSSTDVDRILDADVSPLGRNLLVNFYGGWYINLVPPYTEYAGNSAFNYEVMNALYNRVGYLKKLYTALAETSDGTPYSKEVYEFGSQGVTSDRGSRTDSSDYGNTTQTEKQYQYPLTGAVDTSSPTAGDVTTKDAHKDSTTYGSQTDKVTTDAHTNTVTRTSNDDPVKRINSLEGMTTFERAFLDCFKDCFTLSAYGTW